MSYQLQGLNSVKLDNAEVFQQSAPLYEGISSLGQQLMKNTTAKDIEVHKERLEQHRS